MKRNNQTPICTLIERFAHSTAITAFVVLAGCSVFSLTEGYLPDEMVALQSGMAGLAVGAGTLNAVNKMAERNE